MKSWRLSLGLEVNHEKHNLPWYIEWGITLSIPVLVAVVNVVMVLAGTFMMEWKFKIVQMVMTAVSDGGKGDRIGSAFAGTAVLMVLCAVLAAVASGLTMVFAPTCVGSGIPEAKGYLNGNRIPGWWTKTNWAVRTIAIVFSTSAGFPIGREGPMICIGGGIGIAVVIALTADYFKHYVRVNQDPSSPERVAEIVHEERFEYVKRMGCVMGAVSGLTVAFGSPIGAILYMLEEVTVTSWGIEFTFKCFVNAALSIFLTHLMLDTTNIRVHAHLLYTMDLHHVVTDWQWIDVPFMVVLAVIIGLMSAIITRGLIAIWKLRKRVYSKYGDQAWKYKILEAIAYASLVAFIFGLVPLMARCTEVPSTSYLEEDSPAVEKLHEESLGRYLQEVVEAVKGSVTTAEAPAEKAESAEKGEGFFRYNCKEGYFNEVATVLLEGSEGAVKHLFSRNVDEISWGALALALIVYVPMFVGMGGLAVPMGSFVPSMLIGGLTGRAFGEIIQIAAAGWNLSKPGIYALVGSGAMLSGFTHMTLAIVVLLVEAINDQSGENDLSEIAPIILGICVARIVSSYVNHHAYDEQLIHLKHVPFIDDEPEAGVRKVLASSICEHTALPPEAVLPPMCTLEAAKTALAQEDVTDFPVLKGDQCIGVVARKDLDTAVKAFEEADPRSRLWEVAKSRQDWPTSKTSKGGQEGPAGRDAAMIPIHTIMDTAPHVVLDDMPMSRIWALFSRANALRVYVMSHAGHFRGLLSRKDIIAANHSHELEHHSADVSKAHSARIERAVENQPRTHNMPEFAIWAAIFCIAALVAITNFIMVQLAHVITKWKFGTLQDVIDSNGIGTGAVALAGMGMLIILGASFLVAFIGPICAGSGLPECKSYLNANHVEGMFDPKNYFIRTLGVVFSTSAGMPCGREGPMVCIGGCLGIGVIHVFGLPFVQRWVKLASSDNTTLFIEEERFRYLKRMGCMMGGAAGLAAAFAAPIGGMLYLIEEVSVLAWPAELTYRTFVCTVLTVLMSRGLLNIFAEEIHHLVIYQTENQAPDEWEWIDVPFIVLLAVLAGITAAVFTKGLAATFTLRQKMRKAYPITNTPVFKAIEPMIYIIIVSLVFALVPLLVRCEPPPVGEEAAGADEEENVKYFQYICMETGAYNEAATLLLATAEGSVKHLYSRTVETMHLGPLALSFFTYMILGMGLAGMSIPMGFFVPSMVIGAMLGRFIGEAFQPLVGTSAPGIYALIGSAAMLGGFTQMTLAIVMLLVEVSLDLDLIGPIMLGVFVAHVVARQLNPHGWDEILIHKKGIDYLEPDLPDCIDGARVTAAHVCSELPEDAKLPPHASVDQVVAALAQEKIKEFPVLEGNICIGLVTRERLEVALKAAEEDMEVAQPKTDVDWWQKNYDAKLKTLLSDTSDNAEEGGHSIPLHLIMDPSPYTLLEDIPLGRLLPLYTKAGVAAACVISKSGEFRGILYKADILRYEHEAEHAHAEGHHPPRGPPSKDTVISVDDVNLWEKGPKPDVLGASSYPDAYGANHGRSASRSTVRGLLDCLGFGSMESTGLR